MEIDDIETGALLQRFGSMQTEDRSESIKQMRKLVGGDHALSEAKASFYLEMSNWNVHAAVGHYFDLEASQDASQNLGPLLRMTFVCDSTVGEGESVAPNSLFVKTWTVSNPGPEIWPAGVVLKLVRGHQMGVISTSISVPALRVGESANVSVQMKSPESPGTFDSEWRLCSPNGVYFGDSIFCIVSVEPCGTLALTQQLNAFNVNPNSANETVQHNPFEMSNIVSMAPRPVSPTDAQVSDVSPRNVLSRIVSNQDLMSNVSAPPPRIDEDDEMN